MTTYTAGTSHTDPGAATGTRAPCRCCPPDDPGCRLECLARPRFYCGQLLFDDDLAAMVRWASGRLGLQRFHDGWGVACGLDVRRHPQRPLWVAVDTGYAVSCCGDDIVVCDEAALDLAGALDAGDPCASPAAVVAPAPPAGDKPPPSATVVAGMAEQLTAPAPTAPGPPAATDRWVDVVVRYAEREAEPRASLRHSDCVQAPDCEPARIHESYELAWAPSPDDPGQAEADEWCKGYERCLDVVREFNAQAGADWKTQQAWLVTWIDRHPPGLVGDLRDRVCAWTSADQVKKEHVEVLLRLVLECRWAYTRRPCPSCQRATGVRLARVRLGSPGKGAPPRVLAVDNHPPFRRPLTPEVAPAQFGRLNVGHLIGERWSEARRRLAGLGLRPRQETVTLTGTAGALLTALEKRCPIVPADGEVTVQVVALGPGPAGERVVGLQAGAGATPGAGSGLTEPEWRRLELDRLKAVRGISDAFAERLYDAGLTLGRIATTDDSRRAEIEAEIAKHLPQRSQRTAGQVFDQAREVWDRSYGTA